MVAVSLYILSGIYLLADQHAEPGQSNESNTLNTVNPDSSSNVISSAPALPENTGQLPLENDTDLNTPGSRNISTSAAKKSLLLQDNIGTVGSHKVRLSPVPVSKCKKTSSPISVTKVVKTKHIKDIPGPAKAASEVNKN